MRTPKRRSDLRKLKAGVVFDSKGKPLSEKDLMERVEEAEAEVREGKYVTIAQLKKESEKW